MPWWSWILIWFGLILCLLGMLAVFAVVLFRKLMAAGDAAAALGDQLAALDSTIDDLEPARFSPAVFANVSELADDVHRRRAENAQRRQMRLDRRIEHGKLFRYAPDEPED